MSAREREPTHVPRRRRGGVALALGVAALAAGVLFVADQGEPVRRATLTAGLFGTTRAIVTESLIAAAASRGVEARLVEVTGTADEVDRVNTGAVDFALVSGAFRIQSREHVREVAPLHVEALHMLVKSDLVEPVGRSLRALRGRTIALGEPKSASEGLAAAVMGFAGLGPGDGTGDTFRATHIDRAEAEALLDRGDVGRLPDAVFHLATLPSTVVLRLIRTGRYQLVPLPFADALRLNALIRDAPARDDAAEIDCRYVADIVIPPFTYRTDPPAPAEPLHTLGTRLMLVANDAVPADTVTLVLDAVFGSSFAHIAEPPLDRSLLTLPERLPYHPGTTAFLQRDRPVITSENVDAISNTLSILGAFVGGGLFLWQWWRQRESSRRDELFGSYALEVATIERKVADLELSATLQLEPLVALQRDLLQLKIQALERFAAGDFGEQAALSDLIVSLNAARDHIGDLILHVRENLEERAETEGRTAQSLWAEAIKKPEEPDGSS